MAKFTILPTDMTLYSPQEPKGRTFLAGDQWPGDAWTDKPGEGVGKGTVAQAAKDVEEAQKRAETMGKTIESLNHDLAQAQGEAANLKTALADAERGKADAEKERDEAKAEAEEAVRRRDQAEADASGLRSRVATAENAAQAAEEARGRIRELEADLESIGALTAEDREALKAKLAKFAALDLDGDGSPGGSKPKKPAAGAA